VNTGITGSYATPAIILKHCNLPTWYNYILTENCSHILMQHPHDPCNGDLSIYCGVGIQFLNICYMKFSPRLLTMDRPIQSAQKVHHNKELRL